MRIENTRWNQEEKSMEKKYPYRQGTLYIYFYLTCDPQTSTGSFDDNSGVRESVLKFVMKYLKKKIVFLQICN